MLLRNILKVLNRLLPPAYACGWDQMLGLQLGDKEQEVKKILLTLDVTSAVVEKAVKQKVDLIVSHHTLLFKELNKLDLSAPLGKIIQKLIKNNIAVFVAHTNLDTAPDGINWILARQEGLEPLRCQVLEPTYTENLLKYAVYVPQTHLEKVAAAAAEAGAGHLGNYSACSFRTAGTGTFKPGTGAKPYLGKRDRLEYAEEVKFETIVRAEQVGDLLNAVRRVHPYEEIAYDLYPLQNKGRTYGIGLLGRPERELKLKGKKIKQLAVCSGSGGSLIQKAFDKGADAFVLGEAGYHDQLLAEELGLELIIKGHKQTEDIYIPVWRKKLSAELKEIEVLG